MMESERRKSAIIEDSLQIFLIKNKHFRPRTPFATRDRYVRHRGSQIIKIDEIISFMTYKISPIITSLVVSAGLQDRLKK